MTESHPFRFGVIGENAHTAEMLVQTARAAEHLGYSTFLLRDHFVREPFGDQLAPLMALTAVASATQTLRLGTLVLANDYRHPVMLAKEAATLDHLSGGRLELGLGAGWLRDEYERAGMPFDAPGTRVGRLEEAVMIVKSLLSGRPTTFAGGHYCVSSLSTYPAAHQRPHPPLLIGAGSERMLRLAGREADIVGILPKAVPDGTISGEYAERTAETTKQKVGWIRDGAGSRFDQIVLSMLVSPRVTDDVPGIAAEFAARRGWGRLDARTVLTMPSVFIGSVGHIADTMRARREEYGFSYYVISDSIMESFAPVVEELTGS
ncbi:TIGR03621 family F420-dependent LLM class oxidoreductase [Phytoactinopolyspora halotolerans]|uniref:TIGR03621 family F420-dependent LLM class oxidoreductase n=1 Tax=Phytoactinopolyspora halotolerans TaxID=1981512 RepID=A0A6L9SEP7_9ACTN|nr:TIGR03621 family F420-dependent LLM class oxidoreductase [Phytoactinopolyspora halotolerans]NEE03557.1 TIGR03621 family F420-dependent LLM class oxidoreductase [Phytoactinopolyspora halotolerans]